MSQLTAMARGSLTVAQCVLRGSYRYRSGKLAERKLISAEKASRIEKGMRFRERMGMSGEEGEEGGAPQGKCAKWCTGLRDWWQWEGPRVRCQLVFLALNAWMYGYGYYGHAGVSDAPYFQHAKGCGSVLNLNCALILVPVCRPSS